METKKKLKEMRTEVLTRVRDFLDSGDRELTPTDLRVLRSTKILLSAIKEGVDLDSYDEMTGEELKAARLVKKHLIEEWDASAEEVMLFDYE